MRKAPEKTRKLLLQINHYFNIRSRAAQLLRDEVANTNGRIGRNIQFFQPEIGGTWTNISILSSTQRSCTHVSVYIPISSSTSGYDRTGKTDRHDTTAVIKTQCQSKVKSMMSYHARAANCTVKPRAKSNALAVESPIPQKKTSFMI